MSPFSAPRLPCLPAESPQVLLEPRGTLVPRLPSEGSGRRSPSALPGHGCQRGSVKGKVVPLAPFQELEGDPEPTRSYGFRRKSVAKPEQVLEESARRPRVPVLSTHSKVGTTQRL